jgi:hypothetical protein
MDARYTVSVFIAAPGTPLKDGGTSAAGHVYYEISNGRTKASYGFAPIDHGVATGAGMVYDSDAGQYQQPFYTRTMEVSSEQYEKLKEFGDTPDAHGFSTAYHGATNSCIDFTWGALNHAGLHRTNMLFQKDKDFEGALKPLSNEEPIRSIRAPFPGSDLNREVHNRMPMRSLMQRIISEEGGSPALHSLPANQLPAINMAVDPLLAQAREAMIRLEDGLGRDYDDKSECMAASAACLAKENGFSRIDHVVLSQATTTSRQGENVFVVQGDPSDPAHRRVHMPTAEALQTPAEESVRRLQNLEPAFALGQQQVQNEAMMQEEQRGRVMG